MWAMVESDGDVQQQQQCHVSLIYVLSYEYLRAGLIQLNAQYNKLTYGSDSQSCSPYIPLTSSNTAAADTQHRKQTTTTSYNHTTTPHRQHTLPFTTQP